VHTNKRQEIIRLQGALIWFHQIESHCISQKTGKYQKLSIRQTHNSIQLPLDVGGLANNEIKPLWGTKRAYNTATIE
jgi:hypothetical protein